MTETKLAPPISTLVDFVKPQISDLADLIELQAEDDTMRYYGGTQQQKSVEHRLELALKHEARFGYGLWHLYAKNTNTFIGIGGIIHYNFDFDATQLEAVLCLKRTAQKEQYGHHVMAALQLWAIKVKLTKDIVVRVEPGNSRMLALIDTHYVPNNVLTRITSASSDGDYVVYQMNRSIL